MKCANCESPISIDEPIFLHRSDDRVLVFCAHCEEELKDDRVAVHNFVEKN